MSWYSFYKAHRYIYIIYLLKSFFCGSVVWMFFGLQSCQKLHIKTRLHSLFPSPISFLLSFASFWTFFGPWSPDSVPFYKKHSSFHCHHFQNLGTKSVTFSNMIGQWKWPDASCLITFAQILFYLFSHVGFAHALASHWFYQMFPLKTTYLSTRCAVQVTMVTPSSFIKINSRLWGNSRC